MANSFSRFYGAANPAFTGALAGLQNNDTITATFSTVASPPSSVGTYPMLAALNDLGSKLPNYIVITNAGTLAVTPAALTVTANSTNRVYGAANPAFAGSLGGLQNFDNITAAFSSTASPASAIVTYPILPALADPGAKLGNYTVTTNSGTLTVNPAALNVTANNTIRVYGTANPVFSPIYSGFVNGDGLSVVSGSPVFTTPATSASPVGQYPITVSGILSAANYSFAFTNGALTVTPAALIVLANGTNRLYGAANPAFTGGISGVQNSDNITPTFSSAAVQTSPVGTYPILPVLGDPGAKLGNYTVTTNGGTLTVNPAALMVAANNTNRIYGAANPAFTGGLGGLQNSDSITAAFSSSATPASSVGTYPIVPVLTDPGATLANYTVMTNSGILTVTQAALTVTASSTNRLYGAANPVFTGALSGLQNSDNITATFTSTAGPASPDGTYTIIPIQADPSARLANYTVATNNGILTITGTNATPVFITAPSLVAQVFSLSVRSDPTKTYTLQFKNSLTDPTWTDGQTVAGTGSPITLTDQNATTPTRVYRVQINQ
jgi:hypothetical protein